MWVAKTCSLLLITGAGATAADMSVPAAGGTFVFRDVKAWRYSDVRQEMIPELAATLENNTGLEWREARFRVSVTCPQGESQSFVVKLNAVEIGAQPIRATAYDAIGKVAACETSPIAVEFLRGEEIPATEMPSYVIVGFSYRGGDGSTSLLLDGITILRRPAEVPLPSSPVLLRDRGEALGRRPGSEELAYYAFRVEPGELALSGFLHSSEIPPLEKFQRWYTVPAGKAVFLGSFEMSRSSHGVPLVEVSKDPGGYQWLRVEHPVIKGREVTIPSSR
jgi:hypothetical protein